MGANLDSIIKSTKTTDIKVINKKTRNTWVLPVLIVFALVIFLIKKNNQENYKFDMKISALQAQIYRAYIQGQLDPVPYQPDKFEELINEGVRKLESGEMPTFEEMSAMKLAAARGARIRELLDKLIDFLKEEKPKSSKNPGLNMPPASPVLVLRKALKLTLSDLAAKSGLAVSTISSVETGALKKLKDSTWEKLAEIFQVEVEWLKEQNQKYINGL